MKSLFGFRPRVNLNELIAQNDVSQLLSVISNSRLSGFRLRAVVALEQVLDKLDDEHVAKLAAEILWHCCMIEQNPDIEVGMYAIVRKWDPERALKIPTERVVRHLVKRIDGPSEAAYQALLKLGMIGDSLALGHLLKYLEHFANHGPLELTKQTVKAIATVGTPAVEPLLRILTGDPELTEILNVRFGDFMTRWPAIDALAMIGNDHAIVALAKIAPGDQKAKDALKKIGAAAVDPLITILENKQEDWLVRDRVADVLGDLGDVRAVDPLIDVLKDNDANSNLRRSSAFALGKLGDHRAEGALSTIVAICKEQDVREAAQQSLHELRSGEVKGGLKAPETLPKALSEIGILFDIDKLGGGFYAWEAYKIFFAGLDPQQLTNCTLFDGDTTETLQGTARLFCIAVQSLDTSKIAYVKAAISSYDDKGLLPPVKRFVEGSVTAQHPLVLEGEINNDGILVTRKGSIIAGEKWAEGTAWTISKPQ